jgi:hypothetical protein
LAEKQCANAARLSGLGPKLVLLNAFKILSDDEFESLWKFKELHNTGAHESFFDVSESQVREIDSGANNVKTLCMQAVSRIWNKDGIFFATKFAGEMLDFKNLGFLKKPLDEPFKSWRLLAS